MTRSAAVALLAVAAAGATGPVVPADWNAPQATLEAVQMPAWVERGSARIPLTPGMPLYATDDIRTGAEARVLIKLADESRVKLGENTQMSIVAVGTTRDNVFSAALNVLAGAVRVTMSAGAERHEISLRVGAVTAALGTSDVWAKAAADRDLVCLIDGKIEVQRESDTALPMDQPVAVYVAPNGAPAGEIEVVDPERMAQWALETEIAEGKGAARVGGTWQVVVASGASENDVLKVYEGLRAAGYAVEIQPLKIAGKRIYDARIVNLPSKAEAGVLANSLVGKYGIAMPSVTQ